MNTKSFDDLIDGIQSRSPSTGFTHTFYRYPARFSPEFARSAILAFSQPGDVILDPFMGSGTTLVEALASGRHAIGTDISSLAHFVSRVKTTILKSKEILEIQNWMHALPDGLVLRDLGANSEEVQGSRYSKYLPWTVRKTIELGLQRIDLLPTSRQRDFARCGLLKTAQWAVDGTRRFPAASEMRVKLIQVLQAQILGMESVRQAVRAQGLNPKILCFNTPASDLDQSYWETKLKKRPILVVTSPPYPNVHVLYHRWQVNGGKETAAPFWIAGTCDGQGESHYSMGGRSQVGVKKYFSSIEKSFGDIHGLLAKKALVVQLIAFSEVRDQLPKYLNAMTSAGYRQVKIDTLNGKPQVWRNVPSRKWYATLKGDTSSSRELLLVHERVSG